MVPVPRDHVATFLRSFLRTSSSCRVVCILCALLKHSSIDNHARFQSDRLLAISIHLHSWNVDSGWGFHGLPLAILPRFAHLRLADGRKNKHLGYLKACGAKHSHELGRCGCVYSAWPGTAKRAHDPEDPGAVCAHDRKIHLGRAHAPDRKIIRSEGTTRTSPRSFPG